MGLVRQAEENQFRARQKGEDINVTLKGLREENTQLQSELSGMRE